MLWIKFDSWNNAPFNRENIQVSLAYDETRSIIECWTAQSRNGIHFNFIDQGMMLNMHCLKKKGRHSSWAGWIRAPQWQQQVKTLFPPKKKKKEDEGGVPLASFPLYKGICIFHTSRTTPLLSATKGARLLPLPLDAIHLLKQHPQR